MDSLPAADLSAEAMKLWETCPHGEVLHYRTESAPVFFAQAEAAPYYWQAILTVGPRGGFRGEFITIDPQQETEVDKVTHAVAASGESAGPFHVPKVASGNAAKAVNAARSVMVQLLKRARRGELDPDTIGRHRAQVEQLGRGTSIRAVSGGSVSPR